VVGAETPMKHTFNCIAFAIILHLHKKVVRQISFDIFQLKMEFLNFENIFIANIF
jgi:hypothetical protein